MRNRIEEAREVAFAREVHFPEENACEIRTEVAVALKEGGQRIREHGNGKDEDRPALRDGKIHALQDRRGGVGNGDAEHQPDRNLLDQQHRNGDIRAEHRRDKDDRQHVGHRVVGPRLHLENARRIVLEVQIARAQEGKDRRRVRLGDDRAEEQRLHPREAEDIVDENACNARRYGDAECREQHRTRDKAARRSEIRSEAAVEHDKDKCERTDIIRQHVVVKFYLKDTVLAEHHPEQDEDQERRNRQMLDVAMHQQAENNDAAEEE